MARDSESTAAQLRATRSCWQLEAQVELMELSGRALRDLGGMHRGVAGQRVRRSATASSATPTTSVDGTGRGLMPALAVDRRAAGREDYLFLNFARRASRCSQADAPQSAAAPPRHASAARALRALERRVGGSSGRLRRLYGRVRALRRLGVVRVVGPRHRVRRPRRPVRLPLPAAAVRAASGRRWPSTAATGTTRTTCSSPSSAATGQGVCRNEPGRGWTDVGSCRSTCSRLLLLAGPAFGDGVVGRRSRRGTGAGPGCAHRGRRGPGGARREASSSTSSCT